MMTLTGNYVTLDIGAPSLDDIARGLSRMPRFGGQTLFDWHVTDHVVCAVRYLRKMIARGLRTDGTTWLLPLHVLLHDAHEALTGDIPTGFKTADTKAIQQKLDVRIYTSLGLPMPNVNELGYIKLIDREMLLAEAKVVTPLTTYQKICDEVSSIAMPVAVQTVEEHLHDEIDARDEFLEIAELLMESHK